VFQTGKDEFSKIKKERVREREREERKDERVIATEDSLKKLTGENCE
jgi:hypothetical protein